MGLFPPVPAKNNRKVPTRHMGFECMAHISRIDDTKDVFLHELVEDLRGLGSIVFPDQAHHAISTSIELTDEIAARPRLDVSSTLTYGTLDRR
eukprot:maker-scaffold231_size243715-snap-gene-1.40 protein:Tk10039 transcript:maker-scaffold231_size243715-snap-gene-1.40-mRNA-1 annotation:"hypothetical protein VITISV_004932"